MFKSLEQLGLGELATFVSNKKLGIYNWLYYKEGFSRELVFLLAKKFGLQEGQTVLDSFCGVGTTPLACKELELNCFAFDVSTVAVFAAKVKTQNYDLEKLHAAAKKLFAEKFQRIKIGELPKFIKRAFSIYALEDIIFFKTKIIELIQEKEIQDLFLLGLINASTKCTYAEKHGGAIKFNKKRHLPPFRKLFKQVMQKFFKELKSFHSSSSKIVVEKADARNLPLPENSVDAIISSPPYLNKIEYANVYAIEQNLFFNEPGKPAVRSFIGENVSQEIKQVFEEGFDKKLPEIAKAYFFDMNLALKEMFRVLKPKGKAALIIGQGCFPEKVIESDELLAVLAEKIGFQVQEIIVVNKRFCMRNRTEKVGVMKESIVFLLKN